MKIRTFIALEIPEYVIEYIFSILSKESQHKKFKWESKEKIHLTLKFIGDFEQDKILSLINDLSFLEEEKIQRIELKNFGMFYNKNAPTIFWAGLNISDVLFSIVERIENTLIKYDIQKEIRKFKPHLTLMRIKNYYDIDFLTRLKDVNFEPVVFESDKIVLFKSELHPTGSVYKSLHKFQLKKTE